MKISGSGKPGSPIAGPTGNVDTGKAGKAGKVGADSFLEGKKKTMSSAALGGSSTVDLSPRAQDIKKAKEIASADSVDEAKVARLQKMIDEGTYSIDAEAIADRLVDEHSFMPQ
jgi:negative regulator of flagellin synthesis FlgM